MLYLIAILILLLLAGVVSAVAVRRRSLLTVQSIPALSEEVPADPADLDSYLAGSEARVENITPNTEKTILWAGAPGTVTDVSIVYLHGFSATRQETAPLSDLLAQRFGANLFYTRFTGHGQSGEALAAATTEEWLRDTVEAVTIGATIGRRVIVIGTSTGATLAVAYAGLVGDERVAAYVLMSPNFGPHAAGAGIALLPGGEAILRLLAGPTRSWTPRTEPEQRYWTTTYPIGAIVPMMRSVALARRVGLEAVKRPALVIYSREDTVVDPRRIERLLERAASAGADIDVEHIREPESYSKHVHAGAIQAPESTEPVANRIQQFLEGVLSRDVPDSDHR